jgi:hypothetical protein
MERLNKTRLSSDKLEPWQLFDMIGGTGTGGYAHPLAMVTAIHPEISKPSRICVVHDGLLYPLTPLHLGSLPLCLDVCA